MTEKEIKEIIEKGEYDCYGIRGEYGVRYNVGDICYNSHQWWQDDPGEESGMDYNEDMQCWDGGELSGTCAFKATNDNIEKIIEKATREFGENVILIAGNGYEYGNDIGEVIIEDAIVLGVIK